jgi:membrane-associated phospholipid phosphatase
MNTLKALSSKLKHFAILLIFLPLQAWFVYCERTVKPVYIMFSRLDPYIPFVKGFVVPYLIWYLYMASVIIYLGFVSKADFYKLSILLITGMAAACIIFLLFPNGQNLRPEVTGEDIFSKIIKRIYSTDTSTNVTPSLHVYNSIAVHLGLISYAGMKDKKLVKLLSFLCMVSICASTVFIKQHSLKDVLWGTIMGIVLYGIVYGLPKLMPDKSTAPGDAGAI